MIVAQVLKRKSVFLYLFIVVFNWVISGAAYSVDTQTQEISISDPSFVSTYFKKEDQKMYAILQYSFPDVGDRYIETLCDTLMALASEDACDDVLSRKIFTWWKGLKPEDIVGFRMTNEEHLQLKLVPILSAMTEPVEKYLDIGSGNCQLTKKIGAAFDALIFAIDVDRGIEWGGHQVRSTDGIEHIFYDGIHLKSALEDKSFNLVTLNHSLHHFPNRQAQQQCMKDVSAVLERGGLVIVTEHVHSFHPDDLNFLHLMLSLRYAISRGEIEFEEQASTHLRAFKDGCGQPFYLSDSLLVEYASSAGLSYVSKRENQLTDSVFSRNATYVFSKPSH